MDEEKENRKLKELVKGFLAASGFAFVLHEIMKRYLYLIGPVVPTDLSPIIYIVLLFLLLFFIPFLASFSISYKFYKSKIWAFTISVVVIILLLAWFVLQGFQTALR
ncbi:MAG: hypothetical protein ABH874_05505 [Methanobacteriota archaeon]